MVIDRQTLKQFSGVIGELLEENERLKAESEELKATGARRVYMALSEDKWDGVFSNLAVAQKCCELHSSGGRRSMNRVEVWEVQSKPPKDVNDEEGHGYVGMYMRSGRDYAWEKV